MTLAKLIVCFLTFFAIMSTASPIKHGVSCKNERYIPEEGAAHERTFTLVRQDDQSYTAELHITNSDINQVLASEKIVGLNCGFSVNLYPTVRCHYSSTDSYALTLNSVSTTQIERFFDILGNPHGWVEYTTKSFSITMDVYHEDGSFTPYGYGKINFDEHECSVFKGDF